MPSNRVRFSSMALTATRAELPDMASAATLGLMIKIIGVRVIFPQFNGPPGKGYDSPAGVVDEQESVPTIFEGIQA